MKLGLWHLVIIAVLIWLALRWYRRRNPAG